MRKQIIGQSTPTKVPNDQHWLNLERLTQVEVSSEAPDYPVEGALIPELHTGWRAEGPGTQTLRLRFDEPQNLQHIRLVFNEDRQQRTQEFVLRWSADGGNSYREIVRQQYHFSPPNTIAEVEDYSVSLAGVTVVELQLIPDISGGDAKASLMTLQLA